MSNTPAHSTIIRAAIERLMANIAGGRPGRIESYDAAKQRADVQPLIQRGEIDISTGDRRVEREPVITDVPVLMLGTSSCRTTMALKPGDTVWLCSASLSLDRYLVQGGEVDPQDDRRHNISDAVAIPAVFDFASVPGDASTDGMIIHAPKLRLGSPAAAQSAIRGDAYRAAEDVFFTALVTAFTAINTYAVGIKPTADPSNAFTATLTTALLTTLVNAKAAFSAAAASYVTPIVKVP